MLNTKGTGPWHSAALEVARAKDVSIHLCGYALGGMPISHWDEAKGKGWEKLKTAIEAQGKGAHVFLWYQGESDGDSGKTEPAVYIAKLSNLVARVRGAVGNPAMKVVVVQFGVKGEDYGPIRDALRRFVVLDGNAMLVPVPGTSESLHPTREQYYQIGHLIAQALLRNVFGEKESSWPGPVPDAVALAEKPAEVCVHFAEVSKLTPPAARAFAIADAKGTNACTGIVAGNTRLLLSFERPIEFPAKLKYGLASVLKEDTLSDEAGYFAPAFHLDIVKGAYHEDTETSAPNGAGVTAARKM